MANINFRFPLTKGLYGYFDSNTTVEDAVKENIKNVLLTRKRERVVNCDYGTNIYDLLFEQKTLELKLQLQNEILTSIMRWVPNVKVDKIIIQYKEDILPGNPFYGTEDLNEHGILASIVYSITTNNFSVQDYITIKLDSRQ